MKTFFLFSTLALSTLVAAQESSGEAQFVLPQQATFTDTVYAETEVTEEVLSWNDDFSAAYSGPDSTQHPEAYYDTIYEEFDFDFPLNWIAPETYSPKAQWLQEAEESKFSDLFSFAGTHYYGIWRSGSNDKVRYWSAAAGDKMKWVSR